MNPERIAQMKRAFEKYGSLASDSIIEMLTGLEDLVKYKAEAERLNEICKQIAGEELMFQDGKYETEMERLQNKLEEYEAKLIIRQQTAIHYSELANERAGRLKIMTEALEKIKAAAPNPFYHIAKKALEEGDLS
ncbi:hypothetical protein [Paenibacillus odorifer]|uniref:hypothetical protein n=1 Tax=Paenibacillus TaxID=44249 RepID=UPI00096E4F7C|nr:hypothetical protein [Paenibacillus odorifer]OMD00881.1 hypothetical protein BJP46_18810 [Paenibacillus odorifer]